jgi:hypothetical protein
MTRAFIAIEDGFLTPYQGKIRGMRIYIHQGVVSRVGSARNVYGEAEKLESEGSVQIGTCTEFGREFAPGLFHR